MGEHTAMEERALAREQAMAMAMVQRQYVQQAGENEGHRRDDDADGDDDDRKGVDVASASLIAWTPLKGKPPQSQPQQQAHPSKTSKPKQTTLQKCRHCWAPISAPQQSTPAPDRSNTQRHSAGYSAVLIKQLVQHRTALMGQYNAVGIAKEIGESLSLPRTAQAALQAAAEAKAARAGGDGVLRI